MAGKYLELAISERLRAVAWLLVRARRAPWLSWHPALSWSRFPICAPGAGTARMGVVVLLQKIQNCLRSSNLWIQNDSLESVRKIQEYHAMR